MLSNIPEGVRILSQTDIVETFFNEDLSVCCLVFGFILAAFCLFLIACVAFDIKKIVEKEPSENIEKDSQKKYRVMLIKNIKALCFLAVIFIASLVAGLLGLYSFYDKKPTGRYEYKAIVSEDTNFNEMYNRFDVLGKDGEIYILEDKKPKD